MAAVHFVEPSRISAGFYQSLVLSNNADHGEHGAAEGDVADSSSHHATVFSFGTNRNCLQAAEDRPVAKGTLDSSEHVNPRFSAEPMPLEQFSDLNVVQVSCGGNHSAALEKRPGEEGGEVWIWGLGNGGRLGVERPKTPGELKELLDRSLCPEDRKVRLVSDKAYQRWLTSDDVTKWSLHMPVKVRFGSTGDRITQISCGTDYTLALTENGAIYSWGIGSYGNLGTGLICDQWFPALVQMPEGTRSCHVAAGTKHAMAVSTRGTMYSWGHGGHGRLGHGISCEAALCPTAIKLEGNPTFKYVAVGEAHSASIDSVGQVWCWGAGSFGRCGHGEETDNMTPRQVSSLVGETCCQVALGVCHSLALTVRGTVWSWGGFLCTGHGDDDDVETANDLDPDSFDGHIIVEIAAGRFHSLALTSSGEVYSWGSGSMGRLGLGASGEEFKTKDQPTPKQVQIAGGMPLFGWVNHESKAGNETDSRAVMPALEGSLLHRAEAAQVQRIACGGMHSAAVEKDGSCWLWGHGEFGQNASPDLKDIWKPSLLHAIDPIVHSKINVFAIALGLEHCLMISTTHDLYTWGRNHCGQLGLGTTTDAHEPTFVAALSKASSVAAGEDHSTATTPMGEIYTWGNADCGKLGHGSSMVRSSMGFPKKIKMGGVRILQVSCGPTHTAMVGMKGNIYTFGAGWYGRLGHGNMDNQYSPKAIERVMDSSEGEPIECPRFVEVRCGSFHTCAVCEHAMLWVFGRDSQVCESDHVNVPLLFKKIEEPGVARLEVLAIAAGANHTLCVTREGNLWVWGDNSKGQLGLGKGSPARASEPVQVLCKGWSNRHEQANKQAFLMSVAAGYAHSMAVVDTGEVWAWGLQSGGRLALKHQSDGKHCMAPHKVEPSWKFVEKPETESPLAVTAKEAPEQDS